MTCIVAITEPGRARTWMGADSCVSDNHTRETPSNPKLWRSGGYLIGAAGCGAWFALLRRLRMPAAAGMLRDLPAALIAAADELGITLPAADDSPSDGSALIGGGGRLWYVDAQLGCDEFTEHAAGSGGEGARCVLAVRKGSPRTRITAALRAVSAVRWDVSPPFSIDRA